MRAVQSVGLAMLASFALSADAGVVFSDDFDGPTTFWRARQNYDSIGVHPPDVGADPWGGVGVLRDGTDAGFPAPSATGGTFYAEPWSATPRMLGNLTAPDGASTVDQLVKLSWDFYIQSNAPAATVTGLEICLWDTGFLGTRGTDMWLQANGTLNYYTNSGGFTQVPANQFSFPVDQWASAELWVNYLSGAATLKIGAQSVNFTVADGGANRLDTIHIENASTGGKLSFLDNIVAEVVVPEPGCVTLASLVLGGLLRRRR